MLRTSTSALAFAFTGILSRLYYKPDSLEKQGGNVARGLIRGEWSSPDSKLSFDIVTPAASADTANEHERQQYSQIL